MQHAAPDSSGSDAGAPGEDEDVVVERDPSGRYSRFNQEVGTGRFKHVFKGFDEKQGIDVAWSKILQHSAPHFDLDDEQMTKIAAEMSIGLQLDHPNIIRCYKCWQDTQAHCINLVTEYFTSGNLRDYRQRHKHLELKAVRKWARQILAGLEYLHLKQPPIIHGDLRCDKIYVNGHSGEIKIGDLGLATLLPRRFEPAVLPVGTENQYTRQVDIFAFGLATLELATKHKVDSRNCAMWPQLLEQVPDAEACAFIHRCLGPAETRPSAAELLEDPFFARRHAGAGDARKDRAGIANGGEPSGLADERSLREHADVANEGEACEARARAGTVRGEDYNFHFSGRVREGKLHFRLHMEYEGDEPAQDAPRHRTIDFVYDPDDDTPDNIAREIGDEFDLSSTDRDICAAALKEWLAKELPGDSG